jgi:hypothetical protein
LNGALKERVMNDSQRAYAMPPPCKTGERIASQNNDSSANSLTFYRQNEKQRPVSAAKWNRSEK